MFSGFLHKNYTKRTIHLQEMCLLGINTSFGYGAINAYLDYCKFPFITATLYNIFK